MKLTALSKDKEEGNAAVKHALPGTGAVVVPPRSEPQFAQMGNRKSVIAVTAAQAVVCHGYLAQDTVASVKRETDYEGQTG
jgi:hypothetical protein